MIESLLDLKGLTARVGQGSARAAAELQDQLRESLPSVVRFALTGKGSSRLAETIRAVARRVTSSQGAARSSAEVVEMVVATLSARVVSRIRGQAESQCLVHQTVIDRPTRTREQPEV